MLKQVVYIYYPLGFRGLNVDSQEQQMDRQDYVKMTEYDFILYCKNKKGAKIVFCKHSKEPLNCIKNGECLD
jgi:hypothetical protein